jgi:hypothetical protein
MSEENNRVWASETNIKIRVSDPDRIKTLVAFRKQLLKSEQQIHDQVLDIGDKIRELETKTPTEVSIDNDSEELTEIE